MHARTARWARHAGFTLFLIASSILSATAAASAAASRTPPALDVSDSDIAASNEKVKMAYGALVAMWTADFKQLGARFEPPAIVRYRGNVRTVCGVLHANNAEYCAERNAIFFDEVFLARQTKRAAQALGTDGDMAAVGIIAHEMGHAVAAQLGQDSYVPYENESAADCLAGAFTQKTAKDGSLEKGDLEEEFFGLAAAGDPTPRLTGNRRIDARIEFRAAMMGHGTREQRLSNFKAGYDGGAGACLPAFR
jgi:predicted metalloprotease